MCKGGGGSSGIIGGGGVGRGHQTDKTPAAKSLYSSIILDNDIWHCFLSVCGGHVVIIVYSSYVCNTPIVREKILQLIY